MPEYQVLKIRIDMNTPALLENPSSELALILLALAHQASRGELETWMQIDDVNDECCGELSLTTEED